MVSKKFILQDTKYPMVSKKFILRDTKYPMSGNENTIGKFPYRVSCEILYESPFPIPNG